MNGRAQRKKTLAAHCRRCENDFACLQTLDSHSTLRLVHRLKSYKTEDAKAFSPQRKMKSESIRCHGNVSAKLFIAVGQHIQKTLAQSADLSLPTYPDLELHLCFKLKILCLPRKS